MNKTFTQALNKAGLPKAGPELLVCIDVDGTMLRPDNTISQRLHDAYSEHVKRGTHMVISTGRGRQSAQPIANLLGITDNIMVCSNGNQTVLTGNAEIPGTEPLIVHTEMHGGLVEEHRLVNISPINADALTRALTVLRKEFPKAFFAVEPIEGPRLLSHNFPESYLSAPGIYVSFEELTHPPVVRFIMVNPGMPAAQLRERLDKLPLDGVTWATSSSSDSGWVDIGAEGITKATAAETLRQEFNISPTATVAIGDGGNDITMLQWAQFGVAMGQAENYVQDAADAVVPSIWDDGAALLLESLL